jgi:hypothetical protein
MNQDDKQLLLNEMLKGVPKDTAVYRELEQMSLRDLDELEPLIDQLVDRSVRECIAIIAESMTEAQRVVVMRRLKERAAESFTGPTITKEAHA